LVLADLLALVPAGVEELELDGDQVEYAIYGAPGELPQLPQLRATIGEALIEVSTTEVADDWAERWRQFHRPILIEPPGSAPPGTPALHVRPPWEAPSERVGAVEIVIDPGQAFGTGAHATTRMCLELLLELASLGARGELVDVGTGSGVLAIAASRLGFAPVSALDHDPESVRAARVNADRAGAAIDVRHFDLRHEQLPRGGEQQGAVPIVLANLLRPLLFRLAESLPGDPPHLIASGILASEADEVRAELARRLNLRERGRRSRGEWTALWLARS
jgi:ribosomal protein L11 methyltransferase